MSVYEQFFAYPFDTDQVFQEGLSSILDSVQKGGRVTELQEHDVLGRAKAFYFSKITGQTITWEEIQSASNARAEITQTLTGVEGRIKSSVASNPASECIEFTFAEITALIESGQTHLIPNNEEIPTGINENAPTPSRQEPRRKPWEARAETE
ncbi:hypothetical protein DFH11DRAFT_514976 [Phellopilus nigrolimitatus]|nr:hypothetical protein DFH11DRAFT_514976 [Phellopilus nigrolimitatus]